MRIANGKVLIFSMVAIMLSKFSAFAVALVLSLAGTLAQATVLDFEELPSEGNFLVPVPAYSAQGFTLTSNGSQAPAFGLVPTGMSGLFLGSTGLLLGNPGAAITLSRDDNAAFNLDSMQLAPPPELSEESPDLKLLFIGKLLDGGKIFKHFTVTKDFHLQTLDFTGFDNLVSVSWKEISVTGSMYHFDNIVLGTPAAIPEPAPLLLLGLGLAGLAFSRRFGKLAPSPA